MAVRLSLGPVHHLRLTSPTRSGPGRSTPNCSGSRSAPLRSEAGPVDPCLEPSTFRLRVVKHPSNPYRPFPSWLLRSVGSSVECGPGLRRYSRENDQGNNQRLRATTQH
jgi:hypothetical protein